MPLAPGSDVALFNALLRHLHAAGHRSAIPGLEATLAAASPDAAYAPGLNPAGLAQFLDC